MKEAAITTRFDCGRSLIACVLMALVGTGAVAAQASLVTSVKDGSGNLKLISWRFHGSRIERLTDGVTVPGVSQVAAVRLSIAQRKIATAVADSRGNLEVIVWEIGTDGRITRVPKPSGQAGPVNRIAAVDGLNNVVTAVRDGGGNLQVAAWIVTPQGDVTQVRPPGSSGPVDIGSLSSLQNVISATYIGSRREILATAVRGRGGNLRINTWRIGFNGRVTPLHEASAGSVGEVSAVALGETGLVTAVRDGGGNLKLIAWDVDSTGAIRRGSEKQAGAATQITAFPLTLARFGVALRNGAGNLQIIAFEALPIPAPIARLGEAGAGAVSLVAAGRCGDPSGLPLGSVPFQTSVRDGSGRLKVIPWATVDGRQISRRGDGATAGAVSLISTACLPE